MIGGRLTQKWETPGDGASPQSDRRLSRVTKIDRGKLKKKREEKMAGADCCGKAFLIIINIFFTAIGLALLVGGLVLIFGWSLIEGFVDPILQGLTDLGTDTTTASTTTDATSAVDNFKIVINMVAYALVGLGALILIVGSCGCCGACCSVRCMLLCYCITMLLLIIGQITFIALWETQMISNQITGTLSDWLDKDYVSVTDFGLASLVINIIQIQLSCCGMSGYIQWNTAQKWERDLTIQGVTFSQVVPMSCCIVSGTFPDVTPLDTNCTITPTLFNAYLSQSCEDSLLTTFSSYNLYIYGGMGGLIALEFVLFLVGACILVRAWEKIDEKKNNKVHPEPGKGEGRVPVPKGNKHQAPGPQAQPLPEKQGLPPPYEGRGGGGAYPGAAGDSWGF